MSGRVHAEAKATPKSSFVLVSTGLLQRSSTSHARPATAPPIVQEVLRSTGQPLDTATRVSMESRFGHDFNQVRVHTDAKAAESARAVNARAYTVGHHIAFAKGRYAPHMTAGKKLLAHELSHTIQQSSIPGMHSITNFKIGSVDNSEERVADRASRHAIQSNVALSNQVHSTVQGEQDDLTPVSPRLSQPVLQRSCEHDEAYYQDAANFCRDDDGSPITHPGKTCYREITSRTAWDDCPPGEHVCFDEEGNCESSPDKASLAEDKETDGSCSWRYYCVAKHTVDDVIPWAAKEIGRRHDECIEECQELYWYLKLFCIEGCSPPRH